MNSNAMTGLRYFMPMRQPLPDTDSRNEKAQTVSISQAFFSSIFASASARAGPRLCLSFFQQTRGYKSDQELNPGSAAAAAPCRTYNSALMSMDRRWDRCEHD